MAKRSNTVTNEFFREHPQYDLLADRPTVPYDRETICRTIATMNERHTRNVYSLILHHYILTSPAKPTSPYGAVAYYGGRGIRITWSNLPAALQNIIVHYINDYKK